MTSSSSAAMALGQVGRKPGTISRYPAIELAELAVYTYHQEDHREKSEGEQIHRQSPLAQLKA